MDSLIYSTVRLVFIEVFLTANGQWGFHYGEWSVRFSSRPVISKVFLGKWSVRFSSRPVISMVFLLAPSEVFFMASRNSSDLGFCRCRNEGPHCWESKTYKDSLCCFLSVSVSQNVVFACYACWQECCLSNLCLFDLFNFIYPEYLLTSSSGVWLKQWFGR